ncbi:acyl carrier protein [Allocatelliglobosispora scoriae]|uniref:Acyl carrier protein n=1 Tax=Allocatelliglobosispora scoriae TaxID=643052 RepID=A0A841BKS5_9ACTN|nr:condensation domain-containing protein [Allocatelliglobosispora scoriae]MBB5867836.1 acyl carrier protein [Allocatelliglobosispora scoriae]
MERIDPSCPRTPCPSVQQRLAAIWAEVFSLDRVEPDDDFFDLGGYSLIAGKIAGRVQDAFGVDLPASVLFAHPTVAALSREIQSRQSPAAARSAITRTASTGRTALSLIQEEVWFHHRLAPENVAYNTQWSLRVTGPFEVDVFERAISALTERHEMLRTTFGEDEEGQAWQQVHDPAPARVARYDLAGLPPAAQAERIEQIVRDETSRPFDLARLPLFRWIAIQLAPQEHDLLVVEHHFVHDGWSFTVHTRELAELYGALRAGREAALPELPVQYADFARWQRAALDSGEMAHHRHYWHEALAGTPPVLALPADRPRPKHQRFRGAEIRLDLPAAVANPLRDLCRGANATLYMGMLAGFVTWLHRYTGERDLCVGSGFANRQRETEDLIGMFVNSVVLRCRVAGSASYLDVLREVRQAVLGASEHQAYPFVRLVQELRPGRDLSVNPLFQVMFSFHDTPARQLDFDGSPVSILERANGSAKTDLNIVVIPRAERLLGGRDEHADQVTVFWEYNSDLFDPATAEQMVEQYRLILTAAVADPAAPVWRLPIVSAAQRELLDQYARGAA